MTTAKQNQKFPFHFLSAPPTPPAEEKKKGKENFWFLLPRPKGADEARGIRAYDLVSSHHARGACDIICFGNRCELGTIETHFDSDIRLSSVEALHSFPSITLGINSGSNHRNKEAASEESASSLTASIAVSRNSLTGI